MLTDEPDIKAQKFSSIVLEHFKALKRFALSLCRDEFDADDLVSETLLRGFQHFSRLTDEKKTKQWLFRILNNQFVSNYRSRRMHTALEQESDEESGSFSLFETLAGSDFVEQGNPEKKFISKLSRQVIQTAIEELAEEFRLPLVLCDVEGFSYKEIAGILNIPVGTVRSRIARARGTLQKKLWQQAAELGIKTVQAPKEQPGYVCTCGKEEKQVEQTSLITS